MFELFDEDFDEMELVEGALVLNKAINSETRVDWVESELVVMLLRAEQVISTELDQQSQFAALVKLFYGEWGFKGDSEAYFDSNNGFIDKVLERRKGVPVSLGALLLYFGRRLDFPLQPVTFPTQLLIQVQWPNESPLYLNPFNGEYVSRHTLRAWLIGHKGPFSNLEPAHLAVSDHPTIIGRWLALLKSALMREERYTLALKCTDLALTFVPDDPYEIRDRGFIYQQLECNQIAMSDYQYFIENCPDDPAADLLKSQLHMLRSAPVTLH
jgi:regulator of sirC expression with transglutaminase-like and TPR domain